MSSEPAVAGVDGCRGGWVVAALAAGSWEPTIEVISRLDQLVNAVHAGVLALVGLDMIVGLPESGSRSCDVAVRAQLGPRRSSVFPAPLRAVLGAADYPAALAASRAVAGRGLPKQAWYLVPKIIEAQAAARLIGQDRLVEIHPELAFASLTGAPMAEPKRSVAGSRARTAALAEVFASAPSLVATPPRGAKADDVVDALVLAWASRRVLAGTALRFGGELDATGLRMETYG